MNERDTLPPTQPDVPLARPGAGAASDEPTLPAQAGAQPPGKQDDRTMLVGEEVAKPTLAWLVITAGGPVGKLFTLNPDATSIGRDPKNDVALTDDACSGRHAKVKIEIGEENETRFDLLDLASTNGTFVNGAQIYRHRLTDGDRITIGETELVFKRV